MYRFLLFLFITFLLSISSFAQKIVKPESRNSKSNFTNPNETQTVGDKIIFKDGSTPLMEINSEGSAGSLILPSVGSALSGTKLYNKGGNLYWGANQLGLVGSAGGWTDGGTEVYTSTLTDKVGIGTNNPQSLLSVGGDGSTNSAIYGKATGTNGNGVYGYSDGSYGIGIRGKASNTSVTYNYGGYFTADGTNGYGVYGKETGKNGDGIYGFGSGINGKGVYGEENGMKGFGVYGKATNSGETTNYGGYFTALGTEGRGVYGKATNSGTTTNYGGYFTALGSNGRGVFGEATNSNNVQNYGGYFTADGEEGRGVYGEATNTNSTTNYGGYFIAAGTQGKGVYGLATTADGHAYGVYGEAYSTDGTGVFGRSTGSNGKAVYGYSPSTGWAGYFSGNVNITNTLTVNGSVYTSDERFKKNITPIKNTLNSLEKINVYSYNWNIEKYPERNFNNDKLQYGVLAQQLEKVYPNLVTTDKEGYKSVDYIKLSVITLQAVKELKKQNTDLEKRLNNIESLLEGKKVTHVKN